MALWFEVMLEETGSIEGEREEGPEIFPFPPACCGRGGTGGGGISLPSSLSFSWSAGIESAPRASPRSTGEGVSKDPEAAVIDCEESGMDTLPCVAVPAVDVVVMVWEG